MSNFYLSDRYAYLTKAHRYYTLLKTLGIDSSGEKLWYNQTLRLVIKEICGE